METKSTPLPPLHPLFGFGMVLYQLMDDGQRDYAAAYEIATSRGGHASGIESWDKLSETGRETALRWIASRLARATREQRDVLFSWAATGLY